jgi:aspartate/methionine/tyrosine aminotransferase
VTTDIEPFRSIAISRRAHELAGQGRSIIHMEFGQPSTGAPRAAIDVAHQVLDADGMGYWESPKLKTRLAKHYLDLYNLTIEPERFVLTCGASPALVLALLSSFHPGDRVALARPGYVAYRNSLKALDMVPVEIECGADVRFQLTAESLKTLEPAPQGVIIASPANPTGTVIAAEELAAIVQVCRDRNIQIISDEIYHGLTFGEPAHSLLEFEPNTLVINSFSKYFSMAGWRLGWLLLPLEKLEKARTLSGNLFLSAPSLSQHAGLAALDSREELERHLQVYARNRDILLAALPDLGIKTIAPPDGAFYIYASIAHLTDDSLAFCHQMLEEIGVATATGLDFDPGHGSRFIRLSFAVSTPELQEALARLKPWLATFTTARLAS